MHPLTIVSLWTIMINIKSEHILGSLTNLASLHKYLGVLRRTMLDMRAPTCSVEMMSFVHAEECARRLGAVADLLDMTASKEAAARVKEATEKVGPFADALNATQLATIIEPISYLVSAFNDEMKSRLVFVVEPGQASFYSDETPLFGEEVEDSFPSASQEISDAGKCRALGRWTACVLHLMRALEPALNALAKHVGVAPDQNWNTALNQIEAKLKEINKSTNGAEAEQWASEASAHLRVVKNAWRNHAAHGRARYDKEQAIAIYDNVRPLMRTLAGRLAE